jgi:hypothetical protein
MQKKAMSLKFFRDFPKTIRRTLYESTLPLFGGGAWVAWSWYKTLPFFEALSGFGIGYLFVLSVQGQFLRIAKNVRDESDADEFRGSFATLQQGLDELRRLTARSGSTQPSTTVLIPAPEASDIAELDFAKQAKRLLAEGYYYAAVLVAAVGFERAAREIYMKVDWRGKRVPLGRIIRDFSLKLANRDDIETLETLNRLRNNIVHAQGEAPWIGKTQAEEMVAAFEKGSSLLTGAFTGFDEDIYIDHEQSDWERSSRGVTMR